MSKPVTTAENLTTKQIRDMRQACLEAGDYHGAAICDLALDGAINTDDYTTLNRDAVLDVRGLSRDGAYERIADWYSDAEAAKS